MNATSSPHEQGLALLAIHTDAVSDLARQVRAAGSDDVAILLVQHRGQWTSAAGPRDKILGDEDMAGVLAESARRRARARRAVSGVWVFIVTNDGFTHSFEVAVGEFVTGVPSGTFPARGGSY